MKTRWVSAFLALFIGWETVFAHVSEVRIVGLALGRHQDIPSQWTKTKRIHWAGNHAQEAWYLLELDEGEDQYLYIPSVDHAITIYRKGEKVFSQGEPNHFVWSFIPLMIELGRVEKGEIVVLKIDSTTPFLGLPRLPLLVGEKVAILQLLVQRDVLLWFVSALMAFSGVVLFFVFFWLYERSFVVWITLFALDIALYIATRSLAKWWIFGSLPFLYGYLEILSLYAIPFLVWRMIMGLLRLSHGWERGISSLFLGFWMVGSLISLIWFDSLLFMLLPFEVFLMLLLPFFLGVVGYYAVKRNQQAREILLGFCVLGFTAFLDILREMGYIVSTHIFTAYGWVALFINFMVVESRRLFALYQENQTYARDLHEKNIQLVQHHEEIMKLNEEITETQKEIIFRLSEIVEARSRETGNHVRRVSEYAALIAKNYGLSARETELLRLTVPMHDLGKLAIPDAILHKPGKLTPEEFETIKLYTVYGYEMLYKSSREIFQAAAIIAYQHHERFDGTGYPRGLKGEEIHLYARITSVADVFDSLSSDRCYKKAWPLDEVIAYLNQNKRTMFDERIVNCFLECLDEVKMIRYTFEDNFEGEE